MKFHALLQNKIKSWKQLEKEIEQLPTTTERGEVFEQFVYAYFLLHKQLYQIEKVYREKSIPSIYRKQFQLAKRDSGVDGLFLLKNGQSAAYQAKFRGNRVKPSYDELTKFWFEGQHTDWNYVIANCYNVTKQADKHKKHVGIFVDEFDKLDAAFFEQLYVLTNQKKLAKKKLKTPFDFQKTIIQDVVKGFKKNDRGKLIAACGTGKTLTALWITEVLKSKNVLFLAPSLALIKQTLDEWAKESRISFLYQCVCSDRSVSRDAEDEGDIDVGDFNVPVTTDSSEIQRFLENNGNLKKVIFSTYQSLPVLSDALSKIKDFTFDIAIFDEAHRTAGSKESSLFSLALDNKYLRSSKRLFMTATQRLIKPWIKDKAADQNRIIFSMDDEDTYGKLFHEFNFGEAIQQKIISDYRIIVAGIQESELYNWINQNKDLADTNIGNQENTTAATTLFTQLLLAKAIKEYPIHKVISFHSSVKNAKLFAGSVSGSIPLEKIISSIYPSVTEADVYIDHINGSIPTGRRKEILDHFKDEDYGIISNARCLTEGVDVPIIDCVYFVDSKHSMIDIVQACGRALRKPKNSDKELSFFVLPLLIPDNIETEAIFNLDNFEMLYSIIQSLRDQDQRFAEWIDELNMNAIKGKKKKYTQTNWNPISINLPEKFDVSIFEQKLYLKIAEVNSNSTASKFQVSKKYGKAERKSSYKRIFKTLGDYSFKSYQKKLVDPTIQKFTKKEDVLTSSELSINNNNRSHTFRLGLIVKDKENYRLSNLGAKYWSKEIGFEELFQRQMLRYSTTLEEDNQLRLLFPYRACLKILLETKNINFFEFAFAIYTLFDSSDTTIQQTIKDIKHLRNNYPNIGIVNQANQPKILSELNNYFKTNFKATDIWAKRTTIVNQFIYFRNHLSLFEDFIEVDKKTISLIETNADKARHLLSKDNRLEFEKDKKSLFKKYINPFLSILVFNL